MGDREYRVTDTVDEQNVVFEVWRDERAGESHRVDAITVGPGEAGIINVEMEMGGFRGFRQASIGFSIDDPELADVTLSFHATGIDYFEIVPSEVNLNTMRWNETRDFQILVTAPALGDFEILHFEAPAGMRVTYKRTLRDGGTGYTINGRYGPLPEGASQGGTIVFHIDKDDLSFSVRVLAIVVGPLKVEPGFLALGLVRHGESGSTSATISTGDPFDLRVVHLEPRLLSFDPEFVNLTWSKDHSGGVVVTVGILPGLPAGTILRGEVLVHLNHPAAPNKPILFNGFVR